MGFPAPLLAFLVLSVALAGCTAPGAPTPSESGAYRYRCPGGERSFDEPCLRVLTAEGERASDAFVAVDPTRSGVMAVAAQLAPSRSEWTGLVAEGRSTPYYDCQLALFTTTDAGRSWTRRLAPAPPLPAEPPPFARCLNQPSIAYDAEGTLHLVASARTWRGSAPATLLAWEASGEWLDPGAFEVQNDVYHARSADGGASWDFPAVLATEANHPWLARDPSSGTLYVAWRNLGQGEATTGGAGWTSEVAWSRDGGAAWTRMEDAARPTCHLPSPVILLAGKPLFACANEPADDGRAAARVFEVDLERRAVVPRGAVTYADDRWAAAGLTAFPDGALGLHLRETDAAPAERWARVATRLHRSADGGFTWGPAVDVGQLWPGAWDRVEVVAAGADAQGRHHVVVEAVRSGNLPAYEVRHVVFDDGGLPLHDAALLGDVVGRGSDGPAWLGPRTLGNPYDGMAWDGGLGHLALTPPGGEGALVLTGAWVQPQPGRTASR